MSGLAAICSIVCLHYASSSTAATYWLHCLPTLPCFLAPIWLSCSLTIASQKLMMKFQRQVHCLSCDPAKACELFCAPMLWHSRLERLPDHIPSVLQAGRGYSEKADIYSFGVTAIELLTGHREGGAWPPKASRGLIDLIRSCKSTDPQRRPNAQHLAAQLERHIPATGVCTTLQKCSYMQSLFQALHV